MNKIQMVDLKGQYQKIKPEVDAAIQSVIDSPSFINGQAVKDFAANLEKYLGVKHVIPCGNGTDALQIAMMALKLKPGDEVIVPAFTYVATAEVIGLLGLTPVMVDVNPKTFTVERQNIVKAITANTKAIVPVHLFGQSCDMEPILKLAKEQGLYVIEDNAQAIGAEYTFRNDRLYLVLPFQKPRLLRRRRSPLHQRRCSGRTHPYGCQPRPEKEILPLGDRLQLASGHHSGSHT